MLVFVYGTLKQGKINSPILEGQQFKGECCSVESCYKLYEVEGRYPFPALVERTDGWRIYGELYNVTDRCVMTLDRLEGTAQGMYERRNIRVMTTDGKQHDAIAYFYLWEVTGSATPVWPLSELSNYLLANKQFRFRDNKPALWDRVKNEALSPSFEKISELAQWAADNLTVFGGDKVSADRWQSLLSKQYDIANTSEDD